MVPRILLVRHGETEWSAAGRHTGRTDVPLTSEGRRVARLLGERLGRPPWNGLEDAAVRSSPLERARATCGLAGFGDRAEEWEALREWDYGDAEGRTSQEIAAERPGWVIWKHGVRGGERLRDVAARADQVLEWARQVDRDVLLFGHGHMLRVLAVRWLGLDAALGAAFKLDPAALSVLGWSYGEPAVDRWNDRGHLE